MTDKERLDAQERAIQTISNYIRIADAGFAGYVDQELGKWRRTTHSTTSTSADEKAAADAFHDEVERLLTPRK